MYTYSVNEHNEQIDNGKTRKKGKMAQGMQNQNEEKNKNERYIRQTHTHNFWIYVAGRILILFFFQNYRTNKRKI